jgi:hypothetical protein
MLEHDKLSFVAKPVLGNLVLCFVCDKSANLGFVHKMVETMGTSLKNILIPLEKHLKTEDEEG